MKKQTARTILLFLLPFSLFYVFFMLLPLLYGAYMSFFDWSKIGALRFVGLENFRQLFSDAQFGQALLNSFLFTLISVPTICVSALVLALICHRPHRCRGLFRSAFFMPQILSVSVVTSVFAILFRPFTGIVNPLLQELGILQNFQEIMWYNGSSVALNWFFLTLMTLWWTVGFFMLLFLTALQEIPDSLYEAARIDGAGHFLQFSRITLPLLKPATTVIVLLSLIASLKVFAQMWLTNRGGPGSSTRPVIQYIYQQGFVQNRLGYASAMSYIFLIILLLISYLYQRGVHRHAVVS